MQLVSSWCDGKTIPENYVLPAEHRAGEHVIPTSKHVPVIDLSKAEGLDRTEIIQQIMMASQEYGFFQVINHGVKKTTIDDARGVFTEFFEQHVDEKTRLCSLDISKKCVVYSSSVDYDNEEFHNWRDSLRLLCSPLDECSQSWPEKPAKFREAARDYTTEVKGLGSRILELISEGLGFSSEYFAKELSQEQILIVHHYPPCPDPSITIGTRKHSDPQILTILLQGDVPGLQVFKDGEWLGIEAIPDALVVNIGLQLQIISNGKLVSVEHRAVTNKHVSRITAAFFIEPARDWITEPAKELINEDNPAIYKSVQYQDFVRTFRTVYAGKNDSVLQHYML